MSDAPLATDAQTITVGDTLRNARVAQGLSVTEVSEKLHLTEQALESIENNQFERLPGVTFARGYVRSYANVLGLDANHLVKLFDESVHNNATGSVQSIDRVGEARRVSRGMLQFSLFVVLLIIIGAAYYAWQNFNAVRPEESSQAALFDRVEIERADGSMHVQALDEFEEPNAALTFNEEQAAVSEERTVVTEDMEALAEVEDTVAESVTETVAETAEMIEPEAIQLAEGISSLQLDFSSDSWLRIVDGEGTQMYSGTKRSGEQLNLTGKPPFNIRLGYAKGVHILYNGEPVDFSSAITGGTARINLGQ